MDKTSASDTRARRYLLAQMSEAEMCAAEEALLGSESFLEHLLAAEGELIDEFVRGELVPDEEASFLGYLAKLPDRQQALRFAQAFKTYTENVQPVPAPRPSTHATFAPTGFLAAAALVFAVLAAWSAVELRSAREQIELAEGQRNGERGTMAELATDVGESAPSSAVLLTAGRLRGTEPREQIELPESPRVLAFELDVSANDYPAYHVSIYDSDAMELLSVGGLVARASEEQVLVEFSVSSGHFEDGDYFISLMGVPGDGRVEPVARYDVRFVGAGRFSTP